MVPAAVLSHQIKNHPPIFPFHNLIAGHCVLGLFTAQAVLSALLEIPAHTPEAVPAASTCGVAFPVIATPTETVDACDSVSVSPLLLPHGPGPDVLHEPKIVVLLPAPVPRPVTPLPNIV